MQGSQCLEEHKISRSKYATKKLETNNNNTEFVFISDGLAVLDENSRLLFILHALEL
ncbi:hypothetical protein Mapa_017768 [Marchantia paleacea]|nr:hypothetical protein Mapa_017768 [Marchantia paleacea]